MRAKKKSIILKRDSEVFEKALQQQRASSAAPENSPHSSGSRVHWQRRRCRRRRAEWGTALCLGRHHHLGPGTERLSRSLREGGEGVRDGHWKRSRSKKKKKKKEEHAHTHIHTDTNTPESSEIQNPYVKLHLERFGCITVICQISLRYIGTDVSL